jgi:hypothetical protein
MERLRTKRRVRRPVSLVGDIDWPTRAVTMRVLDLDGREVENRAAQTDDAAERLSRAGLGARERAFVGGLGRTPPWLRFLPSSGPRSFIAVARKSPYGLSNKTLDRGERQARERVSAIDLSFARQSIADRPPRPALDADRRGSRTTGKRVGVDTRSRDCECRRTSGMMPRSPAVHRAAVRLYCPRSSERRRSLRLERGSRWPRPWLP